MLQIGTGLVSLLVLIAVVASGQSVSSQIGGHVLDASGATLGNVEVVLSMVSKGITSRAATNDSGVFVFSGLLPGLYDL